MESEIYQFQRVVVEDDIDQMNHVNNLQYLRWCLKAAVAHSAHVGWPTERYVEAGAGFIVREHKIKYKVPAVLGDEVVIQTWIDSLKKYSTVRKYKILRLADNRKLVEAETNWVHVNFETLELTRIPAEIKDAFRPQVGG